MNNKYKHQHHQGEVVSIQFNLTKMNAQLIDGIYLISENTWNKSKILIFGPRIFDISVIQEMIDLVEQKSK